MYNMQSPEQIAARKAAILEGDSARVEAQRKAGKKTARERVSCLLDQASFVELNTLASDKSKQAGVVTGYGTVKERPVYVFAQDFTVHGGAMGKTQADKICRVLDLAMKTGAPVVAMMDTAGVCLDEGAGALDAYTRVNAALARLSGVCPTIAMVLGPCTGLAAMTAQMCDVVVCADTVTEMTAVGPQVASSTLGKDFTGKTLGGAKQMAAQGGCALTADNEDEAIALCAKLLTLLPSCNAEDAPIEETDSMNRLMNVSNDDGVQELLGALADNADILEMYSSYGIGVKTVLCRLGGRSAAVVASDAAVNDGKLDAASLTKAARFVRFADCYQLPVVTLVNTMGTVVPEAEGQTALLKALAQCAYAYAEATTAKMTVVTGNAIGQGYVALGGHGASDITYAWPGAVISAVTPEAAVQLMYKDELAKSDKGAEEARAELADKYATEVADGVCAAENGMVDDVAEVTETRKLLIAAMEMLACKRDANPPKKHGNLPL